ncbi:sodium:alanine symporter [Pontibacillus halophilus JSM 076056 = DSM 19796]|uniref:Sodium:alanine symporter n=1 Tax=Pontibacillus halophilus JSM 076056 = DSM 19796 TaxID=1385510 RepID=A0A0A5GHK1_9BACI|nr:sodium:alanine symporter family protein [Pontibacillus halophilus]KGX90703.1 sodium:alanine symporter [Pontibacillus halophilus JSM 076056 = DSM 19796]
MDRAKEAISTISDFIWGFPLIFLFLTAGVYITIRLRFLPFLHARLVFGKTIGTIFSKEKKKVDGVSPFQTFTSALSATAGATNIVGVPVAVAFGGPGAIFWMWIVALVGMTTMYCEIILGMKYREKDRNGEWVGGPKYYLSKGLGWKKLGWFYSFGLMIEVIPSVMVQTNSVSTSVETDFGFSPLISGLIVALVTALVIWGGIKRIGKLSSIFLPIFVLIYVGLTLWVIGINYKEIDDAIKLIVGNAFTPAASVGVFGGAAVVQTIRWGLARGLYTSEAGMGSSSIAYAEADMDQPVELSFWGIIAVFIDTLVICTLTGITIVVTGVWSKVEKEDAASMVAEAFKPVFGETLSATILAILLFFFVIATVGVIIFFGERQAEILFGRRVKWLMRFIYLLAIVLGAVGGLKIVWEFLDLILAMIVIPNIIGVVLLTGKAKEITDDYLRNKKGK